MKHIALSVLVFFAACYSAQGTNRIAVRSAMQRHVVVQATENGGTMTCSGVIYRTGLIVTAKHCVGAGMTVDGLAAQVIARSTDDLVLLSTQTPDYPDLVTSDSAHPGDPVFSLCNFKDWRDLVFVGSVVQVTDEEIVSQGLNAPGISGGGLYNESGQLIGINNQFCCESITGDKLPLFQIAVRASAVRRLVAMVGQP